MSYYSTTDNQTTRKIYNIIDDLEQKLSNRNKSRKKYNPEYINYTNYNIDLTNDSNTYYPKPQANLSNVTYYQPLNPNQSQVIPQNLTMN